MNRRIITLFCLLALSIAGWAQKDHLSAQKGQVALGLGLGMPYGAIGGRLTVNAADRFGIFAGVGYHLAGMGYNVGVLKSFPTNGEAEFYLTAMYGTNGAVVVQGLSEYDEVFSGATLGAGIKLNSRRREGNYWDFGLMVPLHGSDFQDRIDQVKADGRVGSVTEPWPVAIVVGYNFILR